MIALSPALELCWCNLKKPPQNRTLFSFVIYLASKLSWCSIGFAETEDFNELYIYEFIKTKPIVNGEEKFEWFS